MSAKDKYFCHIHISKHVSIMFGQGRNNNYNVLKLNPLVASDKTTQHYQTNQASNKSQKQKCVIYRDDTPT